MTKDEQALRDMIATAKTVCFFGGAGVSTESGIPDFRGTDGLYLQAWRYPPETILSHDFFMRKPEAFFQFYREKMLFPDARPNRAHTALARLEHAGKLTACVTQNIDGLHQTAGCRTVLELHGSVLRNHCVKCGKSHSLEEIMQSKGVPRCACGGGVKPDVVLYGEQLDMDVVGKALLAITECELLIVAGTSLSVYPAAAFVGERTGGMAIINKSKTSQDANADLVINAPVGETLGAVTDDLGL